MRGKKIYVDATKLSTLSGDQAALFLKSVSKQAGKRTLSISEAAHLFNPTSKNQKIYYDSSTKKDIVKSRNTSIAIDLYVSRSKFQHRHFARLNASVLHPVAKAYLCPTTALRPDIQIQHTWMSMRH